MKSPQFFIAVLLLLVGCASSDFTPESNNPVVGVWKLHKITNDGVEYFEQCMERNNITISNEGDIVIETFRTVNPNSNCMLIINLAKWKHIEDNTYQIIYENSVNEAELTDDSFVIRSAVEQNKSGQQVVVTSEMLYRKES